MRILAIASFVLTLAFGATAARAQTAADQLAEVVDALLLPAGSSGSYGDWSSLESVRQIRWQPLPPTMLDEALPDGSYFTRKGIANLAGQPFGVVATGARTMVVNVYFRNVGTAPMGESTALDALRKRGYKLDLARCPVGGAGAAGNRWWRIQGPRKDPAWFNSQVDCKGKKCEGFALLLGEALPTLSPEQQRLYTDRCGGAASGAAPAPAAAWDAQLATLFASLMPIEEASVPWTAIDRDPKLTWAPMPPREMPSPPWFDTENHFYRGGQTDLGGRVMYLTATGNRNAVRTIHMEDQSTQANRGDVLKALQRDGFQVQLVRCGKVYQLSSSKWYRVTRTGKHPGMLLREVRCDTTACPKGQEIYALALDGALPKLKPGEVDAVGGACPGR